ncbi:hypothetical protein T4D_3530 [Trichinella pseudospiralis]|uniref:Uncharacterized protein n=1 Tax=Trichinella pseudospiralis TaxID=6337 RepID=A0A0V1FTB6_TRIPS|nr:hypothetical protein T4D_3530 [Trichinella pseudospiralis]
MKLTLNCNTRTVHEFDEEETCAMWMQGKSSGRGLTALTKCASSGWLVDVKRQAVRYGWMHVCACCLSCCSVAWRLIEQKLIDDVTEQAAGVECKSRRLKMFKPFYCHFCNDNLSLVAAVSMQLNYSSSFHFIAHERWLFRKGEKRISNLNLNYTIQIIHLFIYAYVNEMENKYESRNMPLLWQLVALVVVLHSSRNVFTLNVPQFCHSSGVEITRLTHFCYGLQHSMLVYGILVLSALLPLNAGRFSALFLSGCLEQLLLS